MTPWAAARQASLSFTISWSLFKLMSFESVMPSDHVIPSFVPFSSFPQACPASGSFPTVGSVKLLFLKHVCLWKLLSDPCPFPNQVCEACSVLLILHGPTLTWARPASGFSEWVHHFLQGSRAPALLYKTSGQVLYSSPLTVFLQLSRHPQMKPLTLKLEIPSWLLLKGQLCPSLSTYMCIPLSLQSSSHLY